LYRVLNAHFRLGARENAAAVAAFAARADAPPALRIEALKQLGDWAKPAGRDRIMGVWRPLAPRAFELAVEALKPALAGIFTGPDAVRQEAVKVAARLGIKEVGPVLVEITFDSARPASMRAEALAALGALKHSLLDKTVRKAVTDGEPRVRNEGRRQLARLRPAEALPLLKSALETGQVIEQQAALATLADLKEAGVDDLFVKSLDKLLTGDLAAEVHLDLLEAAAQRPSVDVKARLLRYEGRRDKADPLAPYKETLVGGDAEAGRRIFLHKAEVSCLKCHKVNGEGGEVGPELAGIGAKQKRDYLLESIVLPNKQIAKGFETVVLTLKNGKTITGVLKQEDATEVRLMTPEGQLLKVAKAQIDERDTGKSAMPEDLIKHLSRSEVRNLVEFLASLKEPPATPK
jgi:quinoprotein glucose dehydrogenase